LKAFDKVFLQPGETKDAVLLLDRYSVGYYDTDLSAWIAEEGSFDVLIGASSRDVRYVHFVRGYEEIANTVNREKILFEVKESFTWVF
jgi:beta-glucosidase